MVAGAMRGPHVHIEACTNCLGQMILPPLDSGSPVEAQWDRNGDCEMCDQVKEFRLFRLSTARPEAWELIGEEFSPVSLHVNTELLDDLCLPWTARDVAVESLLELTLSVQQLEAENAALVGENNVLKGGTKATKAKKRAAHTALSPARAEPQAASPAPKRAKKDEKRTAAEVREKEKKEKREKVAREKEQAAAKQQAKAQPKPQAQRAAQPQAPVPAAAPKPRAKASRERRPEVTTAITYLEFTQYSCKEISELGRQLAFHENVLKQPKLKLAHDVWSYITKATIVKGAVGPGEEEDEEEEDEEDEEEEEEMAEGEEKKAEGEGGGEGGASAQPDASAGELGSGKWGQGGSAAAAAAVAAAAVPAPTEAPGDVAAKT